MFTPPPLDVFRGFGEKMATNDGRNHIMITFKLHAIPLGIANQWSLSD